MNIPPAADQQEENHSYRESLYVPGQDPLDINRSGKHYLFLKKDANERMRRNKPKNHPRRYIFCDEF